MPKDASRDGLLPEQPIRFPRDFEWGVGSYALQSEGGDVPNDWNEQIRAGRDPPNSGNGFWQLDESDFRLIAVLGIRNG